MTRGLSVLWMLRPILRSNLSLRFELGRRNTTCGRVMLCDCLTAAISRLPDG